MLGLDPRHDKGACCQVGLLPVPHRRANVACGALFCGCEATCRTLRIVTACLRAISHLLAVSSTQQCCQGFTNTSVLQAVLAGPFPNGPGMMSMGMHGMPFGQMGMMGMGGPMMGHPMMGNGPPMMHMGMGGPMGMGMMQVCASAPVIYQ